MGIKTRNFIKETFPNSKSLFAFIFILVFGITGMYVAHLSPQNISTFLYLLMCVMMINYNMMEYLK